MSDSAGEFDLIARIRRQAAASPRVPLGIGDDCALVSHARSAGTLVAADMLLEGRHFTIETASPGLIGRKALAVNLSDMAAMAGRPVAAVVSVAHHRGYGFEFAEELHAGLNGMADEFGVAIAGGDTNSWDGPLVVGVTLLGDAIDGQAVTRGGARPGDIVFVTGPLGGSLRSGRHLTFTPRVAAALRLREDVALHAMIDISDGLLSDLGHICEESNLGAILNAEAVPIHSDVAEAACPEDRLAAALSDGEDFELAFCVNEADAERLRHDPPEGLQLYEVGRMIEGEGIVVIDSGGAPVDFPSTGWRHQW